MKGRLWLWSALLWASPWVMADIGTEADAEKTRQQDQFYRQAIDNFANADPDAVITPYLQIVNQLNLQPDYAWCQPELVSMAKEAIRLNPSTLVAHSMLYNCASMQHKKEEKARYAETINGIIRMLVYGLDATSMDNVIEIRELIEARLLLGALGYTILDVNMTTRFGGLFYQYHVIDNETGKATTRYFSNLAFMKRLLSNPNVDDDLAAQLLGQHYRQQNLDFAVTAHTKRLIARGKYEEAEQLLEKLGMYTPTANIQLGQIYRATGRMERFEAVMGNLALDAKSGFTPSAIELAKVHITHFADRPNAQSLVEKTLARVDEFTRPGQGAFELAKALQGIEGFAEQSIQWYDRAVTEDHPEATLALARIYRNGALVSADDQKAMALLTRAEAYGLDQAKLEIAGYYHRGSQTTEPDHDKEMAILRELAAKENPVALYILGQRYEKGGIVEKDSQKALQWYLKAHQLKEQRAANQIGILYETGAGGTIDGAPDFDEALKWYEAASQFGDRNGFANLARFYQYGIGRPKDLDKAANYYVKAAENGSASAYCKLADTLLQIEANQFGEQRQRTLGRAKTLYEYGLKRDKAYCARRYGRYFETELKDKQNARHWYETAIANGDVPARSLLEPLYFEHYVKKNWRQAFDQLTRGAQLKMPPFGVFSRPALPQGQWHNP